MSEDKRDLGDKAEEAFDKAKEAAGKAKEKAGEFAEEAKEAASDFAQEAKKAANEFSESLNETVSAENKKIIAGVLALLVGSLGVHKFVLGYTKEGLIQIAASIITCGLAGIIPFIEGIIYLTKSDEEFYNTYQVGKKPWF